MFNSRLELKQIHGPANMIGNVTNHPMDPKERKLWKKERIKWIPMESFDILVDSLLRKELY